MECVLSMCEIPGSAKRRGELEEEEDPEGKAGEKSEDRELERKEELGEEETPEKDKLEEEQEKPGKEEAEERKKENEGTLYKCGFSF